MQTSVAGEESRAQEVPPVTDRVALAKSASWIWLATAALLLLFANGADTIPIVAWLAPVFLLRFVRSQNLRVGVPIAYVLLLAAFAFQFRGMVPLPGIAYYIFLIVWGLPPVAPYIIDRLLAHRLNGFMSSLVFPTAWAVTEYALSKGPYATWGSAAYSQYGNLPLAWISTEHNSPKWKASFPDHGM
jgi:apolipoprotein N-acyltransferase